MASIGLKIFAWAKMATEPKGAVPTYEPGFILGKAVSTNLTITNAEGELYADDMLAEYVSEFASGEFTAETDNIELAHQAKLYGATMVEDELQFGAEDNAPYGGIGGYQVLMVRGVRKYRAWFFPKAKAAIPDWTGTTRGNSVSFATQPIRMRVMSPEYGPWYYVKEFTDEDAARAYIETKLGIAQWYNVSVQVQGSGTATPSGTISVSEGREVVVKLTGTPKALYDNGTDSVASISDNDYTISNVTADHTIAVIY